jgi:hypothetical protein
VQTHGSTFRQVWQAYKEVAVELGIYFPVEYGYAYPNVKDKFMSNVQLHEVSAPTKKITCGNLNHSLLISMNLLRDFTDRSLPLADQMHARHIRLKQEAFIYFTDLKDPDTFELISDAWVVRKHL